jgi:3-oxoacyl-(acyl-carrier-protein) synthase
VSLATRLRTLADLPLGVVRCLSLMREFKPQAVVGVGGTGALEAVFTILALHERTAPPTINITEQDPEIKLDVVTSPRKLGDGPLLAISNSFGFGGHNAVLAFRSY